MKYLFSLLVLILSMASFDATAACPGCCSSHGGISNSCASDGRVFCADGTVSASCMCSTCGVSPPIIPPAITCTGGRVLVSNTCVCPAGTMWASVDAVCHTPLPATACGVERWRIKTGTDAGVGQIDPTLVPTTLATLVSFTAPALLSETDRVGVVERTTYVMDATITLVRMTDDSDYHVVIGNGSGQTMIVEIPHPDCVSGTAPLLGQIRAARLAIDTTLKIGTSFRVVSLPARITGVGFWDDLHGQTGVARNGIELHPVTAFQLNPVTALPVTPNIQVVEYFSIGTDSYFLTGRMNEKNLLDSLPTSFTRTGMEFTALNAAGSVPPATAICRFFYADGGVNSTHFYGAGADCPILKTTAAANTKFHDEGFDFIMGAIAAASGTTCPPNAPFAVYRGFRAGTPAKTANHRYTVSQNSYAAAVEQSFVGEGPQYCSTGVNDRRLN